MQIACLQNHPAEGPARIADWAADQQHELITFASHEGQFPTLDDFDGLVVMGGPMSVQDAEENPNIKAAIATTRQFLESGKAVLGICLGAQMMAVAAGGDVVSGRNKEIGWMPITVPDSDSSHLLNKIPNQQVVFHWHGQQIIAPPGSLPLASTPICPVQAVQLSPNQLGLQFHLEISGESLDRMVTEFQGELDDGGPHVQTSPEIQAGFKTHGSACFEHLAKILAAVFKKSP